jgi:hypothetical protein
MMTEWQTIETAPKDGTEILGCHVYNYSDGPSLSKYGPWTMSWHSQKWNPSWDNGEVIEYQSYFGTDYKHLDLQPTHWMPLPKLPKWNHNA